MNKRDVARYAVNEREHYKMYKQGKMWAFALITTFALGAGATSLGHTTVRADVDSHTSAVATSGAATNATHGTVQVAETQSSSTSAVDSTASSSTAATSSVASSNNTTSAATSQSSPAVGSSSASVATSSNGSGGAGVASSATTISAAVSASVATSIVTSSAAQVASSAAASSAATTLVDPSPASLAAVESSATAQYQATGQTQAIRAVAGLPSDTTKVTVTKSADTVGYGSGLSELDLSVNITNPTAGDVYTITIPGDGAVFKYQRTAALIAGGTTYGTVTDNTINADGTRTITDTMTASYSGVLVQQITIGLNSNYGAQATPMADIGTTTKTIRYTVNGVEQAPQTITQIVTPAAVMNDMYMTYPEGNSDTPVVSGTEYVYTYRVDESNGVFDNQYQSERVNSADNYGSTLTIPVPAGFVLDPDTTSALNDFEDETTITQPDGAGTDIVITVPRGSGNQGFQNAGGYRLAGKFTVAPTADTTKYTASGVATLTQQIDDAGTLFTAVGQNPWAVSIAGTNTTITPAAQITVDGNSTTAGDQLVLDQDTTDDPTFLAQIKFSNNSVTALDHPQFQITIPSGIVDTSILLPKGEVTPINYLPGTISYSYTLTLADGTTETGTAASGDTITSQSGSAIRQADLTINNLAAGAAWNTNGELDEHDTFTIFGRLNDTLDDGTTIAEGDVLTFNAALALAGSATPLSQASIGETVTIPYDTVHSYLYQPNQTPGVTDAGVMGTIGSGGYQHTTDNIFEPILYYVLPAAATFDGLNWNEPDAQVSEFTADDGRTVVKIDYSHTGVSINTALTGYEIKLNNKIDALPGDYPLALYIYSPTTVLTNNTPVEDTSFTDGNADAVAYIKDLGGWTWHISSVGTFTDYTLAQGTQDSDASNVGTTNAYATADSHFYVSLVNTVKDNGQHDGQVIVNLPEVGDDQGSQFTFELSGPITVPANYTVTEGTGGPIDATVLYSTQRAQVVNNQTTVDLSGYMTADQLAAAGIAWADVRSVAISINDIASLTSTGRIDLAGQVADAVDHLGDTGYLETAFAVDGGAYSVQGKGTTAQLTVQSYSDIKARYHYVDSDGHDQYINLPDLSKTLVNDTDTVPVLPTTQADMSTLDQNLIPDGYEMVDGYTVLAADGQTPGQAVSGAVVNHNMNGDIIQYELQSQYTVTFEYVDDATGTVTPGTTVRAPAGQQVTYDLDVPTGYTLATKQDTGVNINGNELDYTMTPVAATTVQIHIIPAKETGTATTTWTITYKVAGDAFAAPAAVTQTVEWTTTKDLVTGVITAVPQGNFASVDSPYVPATTVDGVQTAWRPDVATVPGVTLAEQIGMPEDADDVIVTYQPYAEVDTAPAVQTKTQVGEPLHAVATTMQYVDDVTGEQVGTTTTHVGEPGRTFDWMAVVPTNYRLADGQAASGTYTFAETDNTPVVIHLTHQVVDGQTETTRTITYQVEGDAFNAPAPVTQTVTWKTATDLVTGEVVATPTGNFASVTSPYAPATTANGVQTTWRPDVTKVGGIKLTPAMGTPTNPDNVTVTYRPYAQIDTVETTPQTKTQVGEPLHAVTTTVSYLDDVTGKQIGATTTQVGEPGRTFDWKATVPANYRLADGQAASGTYTFAETDNVPVIIHLTHKVSDGTSVTTRTITYKVEGDAFVAPAPVTQTVTWKTATDLVTGDVVATPAGNFTSVTSPYAPATISDGVQTSWQPDVATVAGIILTPVGDMPSDPEDVTVTYRPYAQVDTTGMTPEAKTQVGEPLHAVATTVSYLDDVTGKQIGATTTQVGEAGRTFDWTATVPTNYRLADGQAASGTYTFAETDNTPVVIHLTHQVVDGQTETTRTITYKVEGDVFAAPAPVTQTMTWKTATDLVTGDVVATPAGNFTSVTSPYAPATTSDGVQTSWRPDVTKVGGIKLTPAMGTPTNPDNVTVTYHPYAQIDTVETTPQTKTQVGEPLHAVATTVSYLDDVTGKQIGTTTTQVGEPGRTFDWTTTVPTNYRLADGQAASGTYTFAETGNAPVVIHLTHEVSDGTAVTSRTINYQVEGDAFTAPAPVAQTVTWKTTTDLVTGHVVATPQGSFGTVTSPYVPATTADGAQTSWRPDIATVAGMTLTPLTGLPTSPENVTVTYRPYAQVDTGDPTTQTKTQVGVPLHAVQTTVQYVDDVTGDQVGSATVHVGEPGQTFDWSATVPTNYRLADNQAASGTYVFAETDNAPVVIHLTHQVVDGQTETTRTITYQVDGDAFTAPAPVTQTVTWKTTTDLVTGHVVATPQGSFASVTSPYAPVTTADGAQTSWRPDIATVAGMTLTPLTTLPASPENVTVTYQPYAQVDTDDPITKSIARVGEPVYAAKYTVNFVTTTGKVVGTLYRVGDPGDRFTVSAPAGYHFVYGDAGLITLPESNAAAINVLVTTDTTHNGGTTPTPTHRLPATGGNPMMTTPQRTEPTSGAPTNATRTTTVMGAMRTLPTTGHAAAHRLPGTGARTLPQTGEQQNAWTVAGLGLLTMALGLFGWKRRRHDAR